MKIHNEHLRLLNYLRWTSFEESHIWQKIWSKNTYLFLWAYFYWNLLLENLVWTHMISRVVHWTVRTEWNPAKGDNKWWIEWENGQKQASVRDNGQMLPLHCGPEISDSKYWSAILVDIIHSIILTQYSNGLLFRNVCKSSGRNAGRPVLDQ